MSRKKSRPAFFDDPNGLLQGYMATFLTQSAAICWIDDRIIVFGGRVIAQDGPVDRYGIPPHEHDQATFREHEGDLFQLLDELTAEHGRLQSLQPVMLRNLGPHEDHFVWAVLTMAPEGGTVIAFRSPIPSASAPNGRLHHDHWMPCSTPIPLQAALWIFRRLTAPEIVKEMVACSCDGVPT